MSGNTLFRIGIVLLAVGLLVWYLLGTEKTREYDQIVEHGLYRATVSTVDDFTAAESKLHPRTVAMLIAKDQDRVEPWASIVQYAFRGHIRITTVEVPADGSLSFAQIADAIPQIESLSHLPILMVGPNSVQLGKVAAAHRLVIEKLPLAEVERLAELPDAAPQTTAQVREFARAYDKALHEQMQKAAAATAPAK